MAKRNLKNGLPVMTYVRNLNADRLQSNDFGNVFAVSHDKAQTIDCNSDLNNCVYHSSRWSNFISSESAVMGTLLNFKLSTQWIFQIGLKYDTVNPGAGVFYRLFNGVNKRWTSWTSISTVSLTSLNLNDMLEQIKIDGGQLTSSSPDTYAITFQKKGGLRNGKEEYKRCESAVPSSSYFIKWRLELTSESKWDFQCNKHRQRKKNLKYAKSNCGFCSFSSGNSLRMHTDVFPLGGQSKELAEKVKWEQLQFFRLAGTELVASGKEVVA